MFDKQGKHKESWLIIWSFSMIVHVSLFVWWLHSLWVGGEAAQVFVTWIVYGLIASVGWIIGMMTGWLAYLIGIIVALVVIIGMWT